MFRKVLGWIAVGGSLAVGIGLIVTVIMGEHYSTGLYVRAGIILPVVLIYGLYEVRRNTKVVKV